MKYSDCKKKKNKLVRSTDKILFNRWTSKYELLKVKKFLTTRKFAFSKILKV